MNRAHEERRLRSYLLGALPPDEAEKLEEAYFEGAPVFEELLLAEDDLIDAYVAGRLSSDEHRAFEAAFLSAPRRRERVDFARALRRAASSWEMAARPPGARLAPLAAAAAIAAVLAGGAWAVRRQRDLGADLSRTRAELHALQSDVRGLQERGARLAQELSMAERPVAGVVTWVLSPALSRGHSAPRPLSLPPSAEWVRLRLPLERASDGVFEVEIQTPEGRVVSSQRVLTAGASAGVQAIEAMVPARALATGTYVALLRRGKGEEVASFPLRVVAGP